MSTSTKGPCRYWQQHGKCFYESECKFQHGNATPELKAATPTAQSSIANTTGLKSSLSMNVPSFTPKGLSITSSTFTPSASSTSFTPSNTSGLNPNKSPFRPTQESITRPILPVSAKPFVPSSSTSSLPSLSVHSNEFIPSQSSEQNYGFDQEQTYNDGYEHISNSMHQLAMDEHHDIDQSEGYYSSTSNDSYGNVTDDMLPNAEPEQPTILPMRRTPQSFFMSDTYREELQLKQQYITTRLQPDDPRFHEIPQTLHHEQFHSLYPLQSDGGAPSALAQAISPSPSAGATKIGGRFNISSMSPADVPPKTFSTALYKATSTADGLPYVIRRCIGCRLSDEFARQSIAPWQHMQQKSSRSITIAVHPNIIGIHHVFTTSEFGDGGCLCFVYDYYPGAISLETKYLTSQAQQMTEHVLWSYIIQIVSALASVHSAGLHCHRLIDASRILVTGHHRIRINCVGMYDTLITQRPNKTLREMQYDDLFCLGKLITTLACQNINAVDHIAQSMAYISSTYSADIKNLVTFLLSKPKDMKLPTIFNVTAIISHRMVRELHHTYDHMDTLESDLSKEIHNGRLFRVVTKLGFINERPDTVSNPRWSETGDRYLLKLFRDFLFHQQRTDGAPVLDFGHVVDSLNKLDAGSSEKTLLSSRNQESLLVVRYSDLKRCVEEAYRDLLQQAAQPEFDANGAPLASTITDQQQQMLAAATLAAAPMTSYKPPPPSSSSSSSSSSYGIGMQKSQPMQQHSTSTFTRPSVLTPLNNPNSTPALYRPPSQLFVPGQQQQTMNPYAR